MVEPVAVRTFTRHYVAGTEVTLVAPDSAGGNPFVKWLGNRIDISSDTTVAIQMDADYTMTTVYGSPPEIRITQPRETVAGGPGFDLFVLGSNFASAATLRWNGDIRSTVVLNSRTLRARIPQSDAAQQDTAEVTVVNPGDVASNGVNFTISSISPFLCCTNPLSSVTGSDELTVLV